MSETAAIPEPATTPEAAAPAATPARRNGVPSILKVSAKSSPNAVAGALAAVL